MMLPALLLLTCLSSPALAQSKIATVDLRKLFDNYWKTRQAESALKDHAAELDRESRSQRTELQKGGEEYQKLLESANDQAVSAEERDRRKQAATEKLKQLQESKNQIDNFERQAQATLTEQRQRMRDNILNEIKNAVIAKAKAGGYSMVIDTAAETVNATTMVVYSNGDNDLTTSILTQLNAGAPIDVSKPATTAPPSTLPPIFGGTNQSGF